MPAVLLKGAGTAVVLKVRLKIKPENGNAHPADLSAN
jgi:hypothetical protein